MSTSKPLSLAEELADAKLQKMDNCIGNSIPKSVRGCVKEFQQAAFRLALVEAINEAIERCERECMAYSNSLGPTNHMDPRLEASADIAERIHALRSSK